MFIRILLVTFLFAMGVSAQNVAMPPEGALVPGVARELAKWRAARYSDVRYKLNLQLEKMSPVLRGTAEIRLLVTPEASGAVPAIVLDWRKIKGHEDLSVIRRLTLNGSTLAECESPRQSWLPMAEAPLAQSKVVAGDDSIQIPRYRFETCERTNLPIYENNEHLVLRNARLGENVITVNFTSPILTSGSAITRYVDKEDGSEYIYSLFVPSDASTAFPVFDQPDIKARFQLSVNPPDDWTIVSNSPVSGIIHGNCGQPSQINIETGRAGATLAYSYSPPSCKIWGFSETKPISTYVFAFAAGPFEKVADSGNLSGSVGVSLPASKNTLPTGRDSASHVSSSIYVRKSQAEKFKPHSAEIFRLNREAVKYFEEYFDYKFPFEKYDLVLIPEFPFGGMEHAGATFLRESSIIFPQEPTQNDHISRALLIFHEASHQWFGDTVTMRWFDDLWLKEGFATFTAYKAKERIMPESNAWKVFYERVKQAAYRTDSTKGTTPIYQEIGNLSAAKSAYGAIVYSKAPAFLRQAEFYLGEDKFQTAVRAFLKKHEFGNAGWEDLVKEFEGASKKELSEWADSWIKQPGLPIAKVVKSDVNLFDSVNAKGPRPPFSQSFDSDYKSSRGNIGAWLMNAEFLLRHHSGRNEPGVYSVGGIFEIYDTKKIEIDFLFPNYCDYGYGIFLLDEKSREYVLKNIQDEKDPFLRSMMWGALWDSVREAELDPREYVELVVRVLMQKPDGDGGRNTQRHDQALADARASASEDESTTALLLSRVGTALNYYLSDAARGELAPKVEALLAERMRNAPTLGQRITFYRAYLNAASSENARAVLRGMLRGDGNEEVSRTDAKTHRENVGIPLRTKDKFDIVTRLLVLSDPEALGLLAELEKTETGDEAKRYAYGARAAVATAGNKARYWNDFVNNKEISESWIEEAFGPFNSIRHAELTLPYLERALRELPNHKRDRKIFFVNGWLGAFIGGQRSEEALAVVNKFLADNPGLDRDLKLKVLENLDVVERAVRIRKKFGVTSEE